MSVKSGADQYSLYCHLVKYLVTTLSKLFLSKNCPLFSSSTLGYPDLDDDARDKDGYASYEICPSCDFQFGVSDDSDGVSYQEWREKWILE